jgi:hypothetical protein
MHGSRVALVGHVAKEDEDFISLDDELEPLMVEPPRPLRATGTKPPPVPADAVARGSKRALTAN